ncbi:hypothetical protein EBS67_00055 [bacterium]|nr:hypothetical protein [bacterium]NBT60665.1 hypothetical protein [Planctomycetia bacterium]
MSTTIDPVADWIQKEIVPAIQESSTLLYEFSRLELRDIVQSHEMLWKLITLNHRLGLLYADCIELKSEFETQCNEVQSQVLLMLGARSEYRLTAEAARSAGELASSNISALTALYPNVAKMLSSIIPGEEPRRKLNKLSAMVDKLKSIQRDVQESINGIKHLGNRDLQHAVHGL